MSPCISAGCTNCQQDNIQAEVVNELTEVTDSDSSSSLRLSANSEIPLPILMGWTVSVVYIGVPLIDSWEPMGSYWELRDPEGTLKYKTEAEVVKATHISHVPPLGVTPGYDVWEVWISNPRLKIPAFPMTGSWSLKLVLCDDAGILGWEIRCTDIVDYRFYVGESSILDSLRAPIYLHMDEFLWGVLPGFNVEFPGIWILVLIAGTIIGLPLAVKYWAKGFDFGFKILKRRKENV